MFLSFHQMFHLLVNSLMIYCAQEYSFKEGKYIYKYNVAQKKKTEERSEGKGRERERTFKEEKKM